MRKLLLAGLAGVCLAAAVSFGVSFLLEPTHENPFDTISADAVRIEGRWRSIRIENTSPATITEVTAFPRDRGVGQGFNPDDWLSDRLRGREIAPGKSSEIRLGEVPGSIVYSSASGTCDFDVLVTFENGLHASETVNVCNAKFAPVIVPPSPPGPGAGEPRPLPPPDPFEEQRLAIERYLRVVPVRYNVPQSLTYGDVEAISFVIETQGAGSGADRLWGLSGAVVTDEIKVSSEVTAHLSGPGTLVEITPRGGDGPQRKTVSLVAPTQWVWDVKAVGQGTVTLQLEVNAFIPTKDKEATVQWVTFQRHIPIAISRLDRTKIYLSEMGAVISPVWAAMGALATAVVAVLAFFGLKPSFGRSRDDAA